MASDKAPRAIITNASAIGLDHGIWPARIEHLGHEYKRSAMQRATSLTTGAVVYVRYLREDGTDVPLVIFAD